MIAALFVAKGGCYFGLPEVDPWPEDRDARLYAGPWPVVAHPPCGRWTRALAKLNEIRWGARIGADNGCFSAALWAVRRFGGVLEHPAQSRAWDAFQLSRPVFGAWTRDFWDHAWVTEINQVTYGHAARKATWLYFCGEVPPILDWSHRIKATAVCGQKSVGEHPGQRKHLSSKSASATPFPFRDLLISIARSARREVA